MDENEQRDAADGLRDAPASAGNVIELVGSALADTSNISTAEPIAQPSKQTTSSYAADRPESQLTPLSAAPISNLTDSQQLLESTFASEGRSQLTAEERFGTATSAGKYSEPPPPAASFQFSPPSTASAQRGTVTELGDVDVSLPPDHPLLARAQAALAKQLLETKVRLQEELNQTRTAAKLAIRRREDLGVTLYDQQLSLAANQQALEASERTLQELAAKRVAADAELKDLRQQVAASSSRLAADRQEEVRLNKEVHQQDAMLRQAEQEDNDMKSEIAIARRATYATEANTKKLESEKQEQDFLIEHLHQRLHEAQSAIKLYTLQLSEQVEDTAEAREALAATAKDMSLVTAEQRSLLQQWQAAMQSMHQRDAALQLVKTELRDAQQKAAAAAAEARGIKNDITAATAERERLSSLVEREGTTLKALEDKLQTLAAQDEEVQASASTAQQSLDDTERQIQQVRAEAKAAATELQRLDNSMTTVRHHISEAEAALIVKLGEQASAESEARMTAKATAELKMKVADAQAAAEKLQQQLSRCEAEDTTAQQDEESTAAILKAIHRDLDARDDKLKELEAAMKQRNNEIDRKAMEIEALTRKFDAIVAAQGGQDQQHAGPLEAVIANLGREIEAASGEGRSIQRRWLAKQTELVNLQGNCAETAEQLQRLRSEFVVWQQRHLRLSRQEEEASAEVTDARRAVEKLRLQLARFNAAIGTANGLRHTLTEDATTVEGHIGNVLKGLEEDANKLVGQIDGAKTDKATLMDKLLEAESEVTLWERKLQLEREMRAALEAGPDSASAVAAAQHELSRSQARHADLLKTQERLMSAMEEAISRRDTITFKGALNQKLDSPAKARSQAKRLVVDLTRSLMDVHKECRATEETAGVLRERLEPLRGATAEAAAACERLRGRQTQLANALSDLSLRKKQALLATANLQRAAKLLEDAAAGKHASKLSPEAVESELQRTSTLHTRLQQLLIISPAVQAA
ncbi:hypothetical protein WJX73_005807 [Symbiochloris irregularis]|uniref:Uncharacterized protein n=1 Tax=Symbiochloris irregularis TaxID=706552 RepID=A0AAW1NSE6_9CHLO